MIHLTVVSTPDMQRHASMVEMKTICFTGLSVTAKPVQSYLLSKHYQLEEAVVVERRTRKTMTRSPRSGPPLIGMPSARESKLRKGESEQNRKTANTCP
jgi:hypothetical protein